MELTKSGNAGRHETSCLHGACGHLRQFFVSSPDPQAVLITYTVLTLAFSLCCLLLSHRRCLIALLAFIGLSTIQVGNVIGAIYWALYIAILLYVFCLVFESEYESDDDEGDDDDDDSEEHQGQGQDVGQGYDQGQGNRERQNNQAEGQIHSRVFGLGLNDQLGGHQAEQGGQNRGQGQAGYQGQTDRQVNNLGQGWQAVPQGGHGSEAWNAERELTSQVGRISTHSTFLNSLNSIQNLEAARRHEPQSGIDGWPPTLAQRPANQRGVNGKALAQRPANQKVVNGKAFLCDESSALRNDMSGVIYGGSAVAGWLAREPAEIKAQGSTQRGAIVIRSPGTSTLSEAAAAVGAERSRCEGQGASGWGSVGKRDIIGTATPLALLLPESLGLNRNSPDNMVGLRSIARTARAAAAESADATKTATDPTEDEFYNMTGIDSVISGTKYNIKDRFMRGGKMTTSSQNERFDDRKADALPLGGPAVKNRLQNNSISAVRECAKLERAVNGLMYRNSDNHSRETGQIDTGRRMIGVESAREIADTGVGRHIDSDVASRSFTNASSTRESVPKIMSKRGTSPPREMFLERSRSDYYSGADNAPARILESIETDRRSTTVRAMAASMRGVGGDSTLGAVSGARSWVTTKMAAVAATAKAAVSSRLTHLQERFDAGSKDKTLRDTIEVTETERPSDVPEVAGTVAGMAVKRSPDAENGTGILAGHATTTTAAEKRVTEVNKMAERWQNKESALLADKSETTNATASAMSELVAQNLTSKTVNVRNLPTIMSKAGETKIAEPSSRTNNENTRNGLNEKLSKPVAKENGGTAAELTIGESAGRSTVTERKLTLREENCLDDILNQPVRDDKRPTATTKLACGASADRNTVAERKPTLGEDSMVKPELKGRPLLPTGSAPESEGGLNVAAVIAKWKMLEGAPKPRTVVTASNRSTSASIGIAEKTADGSGSIADEKSRSGEANAEDGRKVTTEDKSANEKPVGAAKSANESRSMAAEKSVYQRSVAAAKLSEGRRPFLCPNLGHDKSAPTAKLSDIKWSTIPVTAVGEREPSVAVGQGKPPVAAGDRKPVTAVMAVVGEKVVVITLPQNSSDGTESRNESASSVTMVVRGETNGVQNTSMVDGGPATGVPGERGPMVVRPPSAFERYLSHVAEISGSEISGSVTTNAMVTPKITVTPRTAVTSRTTGLDGETRNVVAGNGKPTGKTPYLQVAFDGRTMDATPVVAAEDRTMNTTPVVKFDGRPIATQGIHVVEADNRAIQATPEVTFEGKAMQATPVIAADDRTIHTTPVVEFDGRPKCSENVEHDQTATATAGKHLKPEMEKTKPSVDAAAVESPIMARATVPAAQKLVTINNNCVTRKFPTQNSDSQPAGILKSTTVKHLTIAEKSSIQTSEKLSSPAQIPEKLSSPAQIPEKLVMSTTSFQAAEKLSEKSAADMRTSVTGIETKILRDSSVQKTAFNIKPTPFKKPDTTLRPQMTSVPLRAVQYTQGQTIAEARSALSGNTSPVSAGNTSPVSGEIGVKAGREGDIAVRENGEKDPRVEENGETN